MITTAAYATVTPDWRVAEEGTRVVARRCCCPQPVVERDADDWTLCVLCGREPSVRLPSAADTRRKMRESPKDLASETRLERLLPSSTHGIPRHYMERQFIFRTDENLARELDEACKREERTYSSLIRYALRKHLNESAQPAEAGRLQSRALDQPAHEA